MQMVTQTMSWAHASGELCGRNALKVMKAPLRNSLHFRLTLVRAASSRLTSRLSEGREVLLMAGGCVMNASRG